MSRLVRETSDLQRLELALQAAGLGDFQWDIGCKSIAVSPRMASITGLPAGVGAMNEGGYFIPHMHPDDVASFVEQRDAKLAVGDVFDLKFRFVRPDDGRALCLRLAGIVSRYPNGQAHLITGIVEDVTQAHAVEAQQLQMMAEMDHRVKNALAAVQALAQQTAKRTTSVGAFMEAFGGRLRAMGSANELLTAARWRGAAIDQLVAAVLGALAPGQTRWQGPDVFLTPRAATALSLALHELATNAVRYGALSNDAGHVDVLWRALPQGGLEITWKEDGGPPATPPTRTGFGSAMLLQVTGRELNGEVTLEYLPAGLRARLEVGAAALAEAPAPAPVTAAAPPEPAIAASGGGNLRGARVLIVEDAVLLALELETGLTDAGATVVGPAYELSEAFALLDGPIDAAVLDADLNGQSVAPLAERLRERRIPFLFATGYTEISSPGGFDAPVIRKPYDVTQVAAAVSQLLASRDAASPETRRHLPRQPATV